MPKAINTAGMKFVAIKSISVNEWHPLPDGQGKPEQVHLWIQMEDSDIPFVMRFKSPKPVDELIVALITHRNGVWPKDEQDAN